jgi:tripartite-type tricarboxylate transporter receptor subunit TctC
MVQGLRSVSRVLAVLALLALPVAASVENPYRLVVPFAPGGGGDLMARVLAPELSRELRAPVIVENQPGANGAIGMRRAKDAAPGERVLVLASDHAAVIAPLQSRVAAYDVRQDFVVVGYTARYPYALALPAGVARASAVALANDMRRHPAGTSVAVPAEGGIPELIAHSLTQVTRVPLTLVAYRGGTPAAIALLGGHVSAAAVGLSNVLALHRQARLTIVAVSGDRRSASLPEVPTFEEFGMPGLAMSGSWALFAARSTTMDVKALNRSLRAALSKPDVVAALSALGLQALSMTMAESELELAKATTLWTQLLQRIRTTSP